MKLQTIELGGTVWEEKFEGVTFFRVWSVIIIIVEFGMSRMTGKAKKEVRKPVSDNFAPKRLAINFDPPTLGTYSLSE